jgi:prophage tail gpP-like protein
LTVRGLGGVLSLDCSGLPVTHQSTACSILQIELPVSKPMPIQVKFSVSTPGADRIHYINERDVSAGAKIDRMTPRERRDTAE